MQADVRIDGPAVMRRIHRVIDDGRQFYEDLVANDDGVLLVPARATFRAGRLLLDGQDAGIDGVPTVLAVGAAPAAAPIPGASSVPYLTSDSLLRLPDLPRSLGIVGGGPIAVEFAQAMRASACRSPSSCAPARRCAARSPRRGTSWRG